MKNMLLFFIAICVALFFLSSCLRKSIKNGSADSIGEVYYASGDGRDYVIFEEALFQATSKESRGGSLTMRGSWDFRLSVYDLLTGELQTRAKTGSRYWPIIGLSGSEFWLYHKQRGCYSIDAVTLEPKHSEEDIYAANAAFSGELFHPKPARRHDFHKTDFKTGKIIVTDSKAVRYQLDTETLQLTEFKGDIHSGGSYDFSSAPTDKKRIYDNDLELAGNLRKTLLINGNKITEDIYLNGEIIILEKDYHIQELWNRLGRRLGDIATFRSITEGMEDNLPYASGSAAVKLQEKIDYNKARISEMEAELAIFDKDKIENIFIIHADSIQENAGLIISAFDISDIENPALLWTTPVDGIYFNAEYIQKSTFARVFSKGNPDYDTRYFGIFKGKLIFYYMLHVGCIDMKSGELLWLRPL
jgi:hypothetical protein